MRSQPSQLKLWLHYSFVYGLVLPLVPESYGSRLYMASRAWVYGAGFCELSELTELAKRGGARDLN